MRPRASPILTAGVVCSALVALTSALAVGQPAPAAARTDSQAGITITAIYATAAYFTANPRHPLAGKVDLEREIVFVIRLDTHAGDLSRYDVVTHVTLRNDRGQQVSPIRWIATAESAHHRSGGLVFPKTDAAGRSVEAQAKTLELVARDLGGVTVRSLRWTLSGE